MSYNLNMKRSFIQYVPLLFALLLISSCGNVFFDASNILKEIQDGSNIPEPRRIFIGGNFTYFWDGRQREALYVTNGGGNPENNFFSSGNNGVIIGAATGTRGVLDIAISGDSIFVAGNYQGYDATGTNTPDPIYKSLIKYSLNGIFDPNYKPFATVGASPEIRSINVLGDGSLFAGGKFDPLGGYPNFAHINPSGGGVIATPQFDPLISINSVQPVFENSYTIISGTFNTAGGQTGYNGFTAIENATLANKPRSFFLPDFLPYSISQATDSAWFGESLYILGRSVSDGAVFKYNFTGTEMVEENQFYSNWSSQFSPTTMSEPFVLATDNIGRVYIGGSFFISTGDGHQGIIRLNPNGTIDESFRVRVSDPVLGTVYTIAIQKNGKILIGGSFSEINGESGFNGLARLLESGAIDRDFVKTLPEVNGTATVYAIAIEEEPEVQP